MRTANANDEPMDPTTPKYRNNSSGGFTPRYNKPPAQNYRPNYTNNNGGPPKPGGNNNNNSHNNNNHHNSNNNNGNNNNTNTAPRTGSNATPIIPKDKSTVNCYECGVVGHYSNECPKKLARIAANTAAPAQQQRRFAGRRNQNNNNGRLYHMTATEAQETPQTMTILYMLYQCTSKPRSQNEEAREANKDFWEGYEQPRKATAESPGDEEEGRDAASEGEGQEAADDTDEGRDTASEGEGRGGAADTGDDDDTWDAAAETGEETTGEENAANRTEGDSGGNPREGKKKRTARRPRRDRRPQVLANVTDHFTVVSESGLPLEPSWVAKGYGMQLGCIVRETVPILTQDLRSKENEALAQSLLQKLHQRYTFPEPFNKKVDSLALTKMSTALSSWKNRLKKKIDAGNEAKWANLKFLCLKDEELMKAGPSSQGSTEPWDTPFNRAMNKYKERELDKPPTSGGRVSGFGTSMKLSEYYGSDAKTRKLERRSSAKDKSEVQELKKKVESLEKLVAEKPVENTEMMNKLLDEKIRQIIPLG
ncbi:hypothetical protein QYE76_064229 [Lolium multiflorum]|uniref:CCHC-type domain-containing protein n=1 Tax=Lolium multiflorum TaxID=4521 RepID=A0AAD8S6E1_LOLMU|nr:hypothetical protein QYE76_064229 [Lolium multiflorum]